MNYNEFLKNKEIKSINAGFNIDALPDFLFDFQIPLVKWALKRGRAGLFCDTGLGKTAMQATWANEVSKHTGEPVLILAPLAVAHQTVRECEKYRINVSYLRSDEKLQNGVVITNYEMIDHFDLNKFSGLVLDESSILKSYTSKTREKIIEISANIPYKLSCTATPSPNDFMELGNQAEFLGVMSRSEMLAMYFIHDGGETSKWRLKGHGQEKFWKWLSTWAAVVRMPSDLGFSDDNYILPSLNIIEHIIESESDDSLFAIPAQGLSEQRAAKRESITKRVDAVSNLVNNSPGNTHLIWCNLNDESDLLSRTINDSVEVKGSDSIEHKEKSLDDFSLVKTRNLISKTSICGFGMNWQHCNNVVFASIDNSFESYYQAIRRCWRFGQKKDVNVHLFLSEKEIGILENLKRKESQHNEYSKRMVSHMKDFMQKEIFGLKKEKSQYKRKVEKHDEYEIHLADCIDLSSEIKSNSIDYSIFSPPFASLYTYSNSDRDMGNSSSNEEFFGHFGFLVDQLFRIIKHGRLVSIHCMNLPTSKQNDGFIGIKDFRGDIIRMFQKAGFIYHSEVCIWKDPVTAMQRTKALGLLHKQIRKDSSMCRQGIPDYLVTFRKPGDNVIPIKHYRDKYESIKNDGDDTKIFPVEIWQKYASPVWHDINPSKTLQHRAAKENDDERHIAPLQLEVIERGINLWTNQGDLIFSPFMGIGSEGYVAIQKGRRFIGSELKESYFNLAVKNMKYAIAQNKQLSLFGDDDEI